MAQEEKVANPQKRKNEHLIPDEEEEKLAKRLFGTKSFGSESDTDSDSEDVPVQVESTVNEKKGVWADDDDDVMEEVVLPNKKTSYILKRSTDSDNVVSKQEYQLRLRAAFERVHNAGKKPTWAKRSKDVQTDEKDESDDEVSEALELMTRTTGKYTEKDILLPRGAIKTNLLQNIQVGHKESKAVNVLRFHRVKPVLLAGYQSAKIQLYQIDSEVKKEHFLQEVQIPQFPINSMDFIAGGNAVVCGSRAQEYFMKYDIVSGHLSQSRLPKSVQKQNVGKFAVSSDGLFIAVGGHSCEVHLLSAASMEHIKSMSFSSQIVSLSFTPGSSRELWIMTENGEVAFWDIKACDLHTFVDEGTVKGTYLTLSNRGEFLACGSNTGIVNVYEPSEVRQSKTPKPLATIQTLSTSCEHITFSSDCQILGAASSVKKNQVKLMHLRSGTMFSNFPQRFENIPQPTCVNFSPNSGYMAIGSLNGALRAYRIEHFEEY